MTVQHAATSTRRDGPPAPLVICCDANEEVAQLLADYLGLDGFRTVAHVTPSGAGAAPVVQFVSQVRPDACIVTVSLPYAESWATLQALRAAVPDVPVVLTTTNPRALAAVGPLDGVEVFGKPFDVDDVCQAVRRALANRTVAS